MVVLLFELIKYNAQSLLLFAKIRLNLPSEVHCCCSIDRQFQDEAPLPCESKKTWHLENCYFLSNSVINATYLYIFWKSISSRIFWYHFCVFCVYAWVIRRHCLWECKNRIAPNYCPCNVWTKLLNRGIKLVFADTNNA